jgi:hypothetical protein
MIETLHPYILPNPLFLFTNMLNTHTIRATCIPMPSHTLAPRNHANTSSRGCNSTPSRRIHSVATARPSWHPYPSFIIVITAAVNVPRYWHACPATSSQLPPGRACHRWHMARGTPHPRHPPSPLNPPASSMYCCKILVLLTISTVSSRQQ